jgi:hypothetical protein
MLLALTPCNALEAPPSPHIERPTTSGASPIVFRFFDVPQICAPLIIDERALGLPLGTAAPLGDSTSLTVASASGCAAPAALTAAFWSGQKRVGTAIRLGLYAALCLYASARSLLPGTRWSFMARRICL